MPEVALDALPPLVAIAEPPRGPGPGRALELLPAVEPLEEEPEEPPIELHAERVRIEVRARTRREMTRSFMELDWDCGRGIADLAIR